MKIYTDIDLAPNLQKFLPYIKESSLFYKDYNLKHPSAIYNSSIGKIESALKDFLEIHEHYKIESFENTEKKNTPALIKNYKDLLYCFREHLDDCLHIIKVFIKPPQNEKKDRNQYSWLVKNANTVVMDFFKNIKEYKEYLDNIVNELKHNTATLCCVAFYDSKDRSKYCLGYFVANVVDDSYMPIEKIHAKLGDSYTAFSFRRDLNYNLINIYNFSEEIMKLLKVHMGVAFDVPPTIMKASETKNKIFSDLMNMSRIHFPDEYLKPVPSISITNDEKLKLEYPSMLTIKPNHLDRVVVTHSPDGHTRSFKIPYL